MNTTEPTPAPNNNQPVPQPIIMVGGQAVPQSTAKYFIFFIVVGLVALCSFGYIKKKEYDGTVVKLQNQVAARDVTIESQKNVYEKLTMQFKDLKDALDLQADQNRKLLDEVKKDKAELVTVQNLVVRLQDELAKGKGQQEQVGEKKDRTKVTFSKDFTLYNVSGFTVTNPPEYELRLTQSQPLKLTVAVSQDETGDWHSYATSSNDNVKLDIGIAAVNPYHFEPKWYEKVRFGADIGIGYGIITGVGATYQFGQYQAGPKIWTTLTPHGVDGFFGATFNWAPFASK